MTFARDVTDLDHLRTVLLHQVEDLAYRLRRMERLAGTLTLKIRYPDFATITRAAPLPRKRSVCARWWLT